MPGNYTINDRAEDELITAAKYEADHQKHVDNHTPHGLDDYSANVAQMQTMTDPGGVGSESLPTSTAGELERLRFVIDRIVGGAQWYSTPPQNLTQLSAVDNTALLFGIYT